MAATATPGVVLGNAPEGAGSPWLLAPPIAPPTDPLADLQEA